MKAESFQGASPCANPPRSLKIQGIGDAWRGNIKPQILLNGNWLARAGFNPGQRVEVQCDKPGILTVRLDQGQGGAL